MNHNKKIKRSHHHHSLLLLLFPFALLPSISCIHGGDRGTSCFGFTWRLSFALSASKIKEKARVVAMDLRGHGKTSTENELDLSVETMRNDFFAVVKAMYGDSPPAIVLVGHREQLWLH